MTMFTAFTFNSVLICSMLRAQQNPPGTHGTLETKLDSVMQSMCHTLTKNMATLLYDS